MKTLLAVLVFCTVGWAIDGVDDIPIEVGQKFIVPEEIPHPFTWHTWGLAHGSELEVVKVRSSLNSGYVELLEYSPGHFKGRPYAKVWLPRETLPRMSKLFDEEALWRRKENQLALDLMKNRERGKYDGPLRVGDRRTLGYKGYEKLIPEPDVLFRKNCNIGERAELEIMGFDAREVGTVRVLIRYHADSRDVPTLFFEPCPNGSLFFIPLERLLGKVF